MNGCTAGNDLGIYRGQRSSLHQRRWSYALQLKPIYILAYTNHKIANKIENIKLIRFFLKIGLAYEQVTFCNSVKIQFH